MDYSYSANNLSTRMNVKSTKVSVLIYNKNVQRLRKYAQGLSKGNVCHMQKYVQSGIIYVQDITNKCVRNSGLSRTQIRALYMIYHVH